MLDPPEERWLEQKSHDDGFALASARSDSRQLLSPQGMFEFRCGPALRCAALQPRTPRYRGNVTSHKQIDFDSEIVMDTLVVLLML